MDSDTFSPFWQKPIVRNAIPIPFQIDRIPLVDQSYMLIETKHHIKPINTDDNEIETKSLVLCFCFQNNHELYKWTPFYSHTIRDGFVGFIGKDGIVMFFAENKLVKYDDKIAKNYLFKINRDWPHSAKKTIVPFSSPKEFTI